MGSRGRMGSGEWWEVKEALGIEIEFARFYFRKVSPPSIKFGKDEAGNHVTM
jgi:hypothetical protein